MSRDEMSVNQFDRLATSVASDYRPLGLDSAFPVGYALAKLSRRYLSSNIDSLATTTIWDIYILIV